MQSVNIAHIWKRVYKDPALSWYGYSYGAFNIFNADIMSINGNFTSIPIVIIHVVVVYHDFIDHSISIPDRDQLKVDLVISRLLMWTLLWLTRGGTVGPLTTANALAYGVDVSMLQMQTLFARTLYTPSIIVYWRTCQTSLIHRNALFSQCNRFRCLRSTALTFTECISVVFQLIYLREICWRQWCECRRLSFL